MLNGLGAMVFAGLNYLVGRSWALDSLLALALDNPLVKAGPIGAAFLYAWHRSGRDGDIVRRRGILLATLAALFVVAPLSKSLSGLTLSPRPFVMAQHSLSLDSSERLSEAPRLSYRAPQTGETADRVTALREGRIEANDLESFPSDHATFFVALSLGIALASLRAGLIALAWTFGVTLASRIAAGMHWPLDIAAGAALGALVAGVIVLAARRWGTRPLSWTADWTRRHEAIASAFLFLLLVEAGNAMQTSKRLAEVGGAVAGRIL